ncbi:purine-cytosine permease family protein [Siculibacillus lacustris]|nr:cytosine permease [Siculibacillus lacustris]
MERTHPSLVTDGVAAHEQTLAVGNPFWVFFVLNTGIATWLIGVLVAVMGLDFTQAMGVILIGSAVGGALPAAMAVLGPRTRLPQLEVGRFALGATGKRLPALLNWIGAIGWDVVFNSLAAAALIALAAGSGLGLPSWLAFGILVALQLLVGLWGHHLIQATARWLGLLLGLAFAILGVVAVARTGVAVTGVAAPIGAVFAALLLVVSYSITLAPYAADYTRYLPAATPGRRVFVPVFAGLFTASVAFCFFGWATASLVTEPSPVAVMDALKTLAGPFAPVVLFLVALNSVPCNAVNDNSAAYSLISAGVRISRPLTAVIGAVLGYVVCLLASDDFVAFFENFLFLFAHGIAPWAAVLLTHWLMVGDRQGTPAGITVGCGIFVAVTIASIGLFSANSLYTGLLSERIGGADVGPYLGFAAAALLEASWLRFGRKGP